jgi:hypothetical protein
LVQTAAHAPMQEALRPFAGVGHSVGSEQARLQPETKQFSPGLHSSVERQALYMVLNRHAGGGQAQIFWPGWL